MANSWSILVNDSNFGTPMLGETYSVYAHVSAHEEGRYMYNATYYPQLITLYMDLYTKLTPRPGASPGAGAKSRKKV